MLLKKNNELEFKQLKVMQGQKKKVDFKKLQFCDNMFGCNSPPDGKYQKYKNFYYKENKLIKQEPSLEYKV